MYVGSEKFLNLIIARRWQLQLFDHVVHEKKKKFKSC